MQTRGNNGEGRVEASSSLTQVSKEEDLEAQPVSRGPVLSVQPSTERSSLPMDSIAPGRERAPMYQTSFDYNKEYRVVQREQVANPAPLGLAGFALTTALLQGGNTAITEANTRFLVYGYAFFFGGLAQLLAGQWEAKRQNSFGFTAFSSYGAFWLGFAIYGTLVSSGIYQPSHAGEKMLLALWGIYTFILMVPTLELNFALFLLFFTLSVLFFLLTGGVAATVWTRIGGWWGLMVAGIAFYIAAADLINEEYQMTVLPLGKWSIGRPIMRKMRSIFRRIPPFNILVKGAIREDRMAGYRAYGPKGTTTFEKVPESPTTAPVSPRAYVDIYAQERQTGQPHLYTAREHPTTSFEGDAVTRVQRNADVRSGFGPF